MQRKIICALFMMFISTSVAAKNKVLHKSKHPHYHLQHRSSTLTNDLECLTRNMYHEARGEKLPGQIAVGMITINRAKSKSKKFKKTLCGVVYQKGQFSWVANNPSIKDIKTYKKIEVLARNLYNTYYMNSVIPDKLNILRSVEYFSKGTPKGFITVARIGNHSFSRPSNKLKTT